MLQVATGMGVRVAGKRIILYNLIMCKSDPGLRSLFTKSA